MLRSYLKLAWKILWRRRFYTFISLFGIMVTIAVLVVASALLDHTFAPMPPEVRQDRTLGLFRARLVGKDSIDSTAVGYRLIDRYARNLPGVERLAIVSQAQTVLSYVGGHRVESRIRRADAEYWRVLDFAFLEGGPFTDQDVAGGSFVAVISASARDAYFGGAPAVGRVLEADGQRFRVIGVVSDVPATREVAYGDLYVPFTTQKTDAYRRELLGDFYALLLARSPADFPAIKSELASRLARAELPSREYDHLYAFPQTYFESVADDVFFDDQADRSHPERLLAVMAVAAFLFLLLPTVNLVNLNVSRITERASEIGVRKAFGASSRVLVTQFVVENLLLTLVGAAGGFVLATVVLWLVTASGVVPHAELALNLRVFGAGVAAAAVFGLLSGVYPAWRMSRMHPVEALKGAVR